MTTRKAVELAFLMAAGIVLQIMESFLPVVFIVPGFKIGFANIIALYTLYNYDTRSMWIVGIGRIFMASLLQGLLFSVSFWLSLAGGLLSLSIMSLLHRTGKFSIYGVSVAGAACHSIGQGAAVTFIYQQFFMQLYLPVLLALSIVSGLCIGILAGQLIRRLRRVTL